MIHQEQSPLAGKKVKIIAQAYRLNGQEITIEDWWDRITDKSWKISDGNPACIEYGLRIGSGVLKFFIPNDDEVLYGKIYGLGYLVHISELEPVK